MLRGALALFVLLLSVVLPGEARGVVRVAVASNFAGTLKEIAGRFEARTGERVEISSGSSGRFHSQILQGAPYDVLLSADEEVPRLLEKQGEAVPGSRFTYAIGELVLWSARPEGVDAEGRGIERLCQQRIAIANPKLAPYGRAAVETLRALKLDPPLVQGENVAQAYQFVSSGSVVAGFVALSQAIERKDGSYWKVPARLHSPIRQDATLLTRAREKDSARAFLDFMKSGEVRELLKKRGYGS